MGKNVIEMEVKTINLINVVDYCSVRFTGVEEKIIKNSAYGMRGVTKEESSLAKIKLIILARTPIDFVEADYLVYNDKDLEEIFFERIRAIVFDKNEWKYIFDKSGIFGLNKLRAYAEEQLEQLKIKHIV